jgi:hypothetical protein
MKAPSRRVEKMRETLEELTDHRRRAAAVAALLAHCDGVGLKDGLLSDVGAIIVEEMQGIRRCTEILYRGDGR